MKIIKIYFICLIFLNYAIAFDKKEKTLDKKVIPEVAISACIDKIKDDNCSFYINGDDKSGTCKLLPNKEFLSCISNDFYREKSKNTNKILFTPVKRERVYID